MEKTPVSKKEWKEIVILKIGGSVATFKSGSVMRVRRKLLRSIALEIGSVLKKTPQIQLIIIHGAGSAGHNIAKKLNLTEGTLGDAKKTKGALQIRLNNQKLNTVIMEAFLKAGLNVVPVHTGSVITHMEGEIDVCNETLLEQVFDNDSVPVLYGEMVFDKKLGMSVCSGDTIGAYLADRFNVSRVIYATDVDGVFDSDPYSNKKAKLFSELNKKDILDSSKIELSSSHNIDVTGGLLNKIKSIMGECVSNTVKEVVIFNGLKKGNFKKVLSGESCGTSISI